MRRERKRVNLLLHQIAESVIDQPVARDARFAGEGIGDDSDGVVAATAGGAGVAGMCRAIVSDFDTGRLELRQPCADLRLNAHAIGKSYLPSGAGASCGMWR